MPPKAPAGEKELLVALPTLPKFDDKLDRKKWCQDYDKVEGDLLRNHLAGGVAADTTITMGLRSNNNIQSEFDRRLPSMDEPTQADRLEALRAAGRKPRGGSMAAAGNHTFMENSMMPTHRGGGASTAPLPDGGRNCVSALSFRDEAGSTAGGNSPSRRRMSRAMSPSVSVTRSMTVLDSTYGGGGATSHNNTTMSSNGTTMNGTMSSSSKDPLKSTPMCIKILDTLLHPPPSYRNSFQLNLDGVDLEWMWSYAADRAPPQLLTLETLRDSTTDSSLPSSALRHVVALNSPRSTMVMLRNGIGIKDLLRRTPAYFERADVSYDEAQTRCAHYEERRRAMLTSLREEYREVCSVVPLHEVVHGLQQKHKEHVTEAQLRASPLRQRRGAKSSSGATSPSNRSPTRGTNSGDDEEESAFVKQRRSKMQRLAEKSREKLQRQFDALEAVKRDIREAEKRQHASEQNLRHREEERKRQMDERSAMAAKHFLEMRDKTQLYNMTFAAEQERKRLMLEAKAVAKAEALQARAEIAKQESEIKTQAKIQRLQQNRATLENLQDNVQQRQAEKEQRAAERREQRNRRRALEAEENENLAKKTAAQRLEAQERVRQQREAFLRKAEEKERLVQERLENFQQAQRQAHEAARELEAIKEKKRHETITAADSILRSKIVSIQENRQAHDQSLEIARHHQLEDAKQRHYQEHHALDDKRYLVDRQTKSNEFKKLLRAVNMMQKEDQALFIADQKARTLELGAREREKLRLQKEHAALKLSRIM